MQFLWKMSISLLIPVLIWINYYFQIKESNGNIYKFLVHLFKRYLFYSAFLVILPFIYIEYQNEKISDQVTKDSQKAIVIAFLVLVISMLFKEIIQLAKEVHYIDKKISQIVNQITPNTDLFQFQKQYSSKVISDSKFLQSGADEAMKAQSFLNHYKQIELANYSNVTNQANQGDLLDKLKITKSSQVASEDGMLFSSKQYQDQLRQLEMARHKPLNQAIFTIQEQQEFGESQFRFVESINMDEVFSCIYSIEIISYSLSYGIVIGQNQTFADSIFYSITMIICLFYKFLEINQISSKRNQIILIIITVLLIQVAIYIGSMIDHQLLAICLKSYVAGYSIIQFSYSYEQMAITLTITNSSISIILLSIFVIIKIY